MLDKVAKRAETVDELILRELRELRALVERRLGEPSNDDAMTVGAVAVLVRKTPQCVRGWIEKHDIGVFDERARRYIISKKKLLPRASLPLRTRAC
jgi:hypothetical protein